MNNHKSPAKQPRTKKSHPIPVATNPNRMRPNSSAGSSYPKNSNPRYGHYSNTTSPTAGSSPAVPLFYSNIYADPPDCASLPKPPESWYMKANDEPILEETKQPKAKPQQKNYNNRGSYRPFYSPRTSTPYISVKA